MPGAVPQIRITKLNNAPINRRGAYILYWMSAFRRPQWNFSLDRAVEWARELNRPLLVFEPLALGYKWASIRFHKFILDGMSVNSQYFSKHGVFYYPYVEPLKGEGKGLIEALAKRACVVVADDSPVFILPKTINAVSTRISVSMEKVDSCGLAPIHAIDTAFETGKDFGKYFQAASVDYLNNFPKPAPVARANLDVLDGLPKYITDKWPKALPLYFKERTGPLLDLPIDQKVGIVKWRGGFKQGRLFLKSFLDNKLNNYGRHRDFPEKNNTSGLSPYLHFGHISSHQIFSSLINVQGLSRKKIARDAPSGKNWWKMSASAQVFFNRVIIMRELAFNQAINKPKFDRFDSLPDWASQTLDKHKLDQRKYMYTLEALELAITHDTLWNAVQNQLKSEGWVHQQFRMLWGKKILAWTPTPHLALEVMTHLNNKYALDGRDPCSVSGIFSVLGRFGKPQSRELPVFGKVGFISSGKFKKMFKVNDYIKMYALLKN